MLYSLKALTRVLDRSLEALRIVGHEVCDNPMRAGHRLFTRYFLEGIKTWEPLVAAFDRQDHTVRSPMVFPPPRDRVPPRSTCQDPPSSGERVRDDGTQPSETDADWRRRDPDSTLRSLLHGPLRCICDGTQQGRAQLAPGLAFLYRCTWCADATAMVRKCTGCDTAWYVA